MLELKIIAASVDPYVESTEGIITQSKLKAFMKCPYSYWLVFEEKQPLERKLKKYFKMGTAFDFLISYGEEKFREKYLILNPGQNTLSDTAVEDAEAKFFTLKAELQEREAKLDQKLAENAALVAAGKKERATTQVTKSVVSWQAKVQDASDELREIIERSKFIELTANEGDTIAKLQREAERQTVFDLHGDWESQQTFSAVFRGKLKIGGKPDRIRLGENGQIRELKLIDDVEKAEFKIQDFAYIQQLAFYQLLIELNTGQKLPCFFDIFDKKEVPRYRCFEVPQELLDDARNELQAALVMMLECKEKNYFPTHSELGLPDSGCCAYDHCKGAIKTKAEYYS